MIYHVLNGDALAQRFDLDGEIVVCRECLIDGDISAVDRERFWRERAEFIKTAFGADNYLEFVKCEFDKLDQVTPADEVNLWFGDDAFCLVNLGFVLSTFGNKTPNFYRVFPDGGGWDCSFSDPRRAFESRRKMMPAEIRLGTELWNAFRADRARLRSIAENDVPAFPRLGEVCAALAEIDSRPAAVLREITAAGETDFASVFRSFREKAGVYGFGDTQVERLLAAL